MKTQTIKGSLVVLYCLAVSTLVFIFYLYVITDELYYFFILFGFEAFWYCLFALNTHDFNFTEHELLISCPLRPGYQERYQLEGIKEVGIFYRIDGIHTVTINSDRYACMNLSAPLLYDLKDVFEGLHIKTINTNI